MVEGSIMECRYAQEHPAIEARLDEHDRRISQLEQQGREDRRDLWQSLGRLEKSVENMKGFIAAALLGGSLAGSILAFIAQRVFK